ncbi:putative N-acetyltransferase [Monoraphidium neglectum]|uniref:Putative N-acetyltransferase n=1 Tax=Monoraphidium neglectum TaxID=145388 RepID=A0A0D2MU26_9CHLO|nr:putative N-acetyltransferase [Monoraphidium neglectum]KIY97945.1 putative N-acetyltransferase [Monoraphidium neglectum]|eukprot:XP_013896965.1 putative N-acetyltransferase [Monoraphidium neglectum]
MSRAYSALGQGSIFFRGAELDDLSAIYALEAASYPEDEAATRDKLHYRISHAPEAFLVAVSSSGGGSGEGGAASAAQEDEIIGYVCGTCSSAATLTHESMSRHEPEGRLLCIHSVCVAEARRRKGVATRLLRTYLSYVAASLPQLEEVRLLCKQQMVPLYGGVGFVLLGPSPVVHGQEQWLEMAYSWEPPGAEDAA